MKNKIKEYLPIAVLAVMVIIIAALLIIKQGGGEGGTGATPNGSGSNNQSSGNTETKAYTFYGFQEGDEFIKYFNTVCEVMDYSGMTASEFSALCSDIEERLQYYHKLFDIYNTYDGVVNIASLNATAGKGEVAVSPELFEFLEYCVWIHEITGGETNVAMGSVLSIWHDYRQAGIEDPSNAKIPSAEELLEAAKHTSIENLVLNSDGYTVEITDSLTSLDVGAIAKGYTAEKIADYLKSRGITSFILNFGGNIRAIGAKPSGEGWKTGIQKPSGFGYIKYFYIKDTSVVTSGDYQRYYIVNNVLYHHVIDGDTLMPAEGFSSVSIITENSALADGLSTALFCMSYEEGISVVDALRTKGYTLSVVWLRQSGEVLEY